MPEPVKLDFSKAIPVDNGGAVKLDFSKAQPISESPAIDLSNANGEGTYPMWDTAGKKHDVPYSYASKAQGMGYRFDTNPIQNRGGLTPAQAYQRDQAADPNRVGGPSMYFGSSKSRYDAPLQPASRSESLQRLGESEKNAPAPIRVATGVSKGIGTLLKPALDVTALATGESPEEVDYKLEGRTPLESGFKAVTVAAPIIAGGVAAPVATALGLGGGAAGAMGAKYGAEKLGATPQQAEVAGDVGGLVGGVGAGKIGGIIDRSVSPWTSGYRSTHGPSMAHEAVLADIGGDYVPREQSSKTLNVIRNQAAAQPEVVKAINGKDPQAAVAAHVNIIDKAIKSIDDIHDAARAPVRNFPVNSRGILGDFLPEQSKFNVMPEAQQQQVVKLAERISGTSNLEDLNNLRIQLGEEDLGARDMQTEPSPGYKTTLHRAANAVRKAYYDRLAQVTGKDFTEIKRTEGALKEERHFAQKKQPALSQAEVKAKTATGREKAGDIISSSAHGSMGIPLVSAAADAVRGTDLANLQTHLKTIYSDLPEHVPVSVSGGMPPVRGELPAVATSPLRPGLPASVIPNADEFGRVDTGRVPNRPTGFNVKPGEQAYPHEQVRPGPPTPATGPTVPPKPAEFLRLQSGEPGRVGAKSVEHVGARPSPKNQPPSFNPETAVERITPKLGSSVNIPDSGSFRVIQSRPNGEMVIQQTRQLPSGEHAQIPAQASPSTVSPSSPQLPPVGYTFTGPDGVVRTVTKVSKDGTVTLKEIPAPKKRPGDILPKNQ
jgi:hypothetical protein